MRLEIVIPDSVSRVRRERFTQLVQYLNAEPALIDDLWLPGEVSDAEDATIQAKFTPEVIAALERDHQEILDGKGLTPEQVQASLDQTRREWRAAHQG